MLAGRRTFSGLIVFAAACAPSALAKDESARDFFEARVRPVLIERCFECHSSSAKKPKGGLRLDTREGWARGGDSGPAIVPGDVDASLLVRAVRYGDHHLAMPPAGKLDEREIADLIEWVRSGAFDPRIDAPAAAESVETVRAPHWAFEPVREVLPPRVRDERWPANAIDRFLLARIEEHELEVAPDADRRTLIRRLSFDLLGLPPSIDEVDAFVADAAPDAWERLVERLLASPHYGERQARRWLDLARYSDSNGLDENLALANAWRYRDAVVRAFQEDLPYARFVIEQLAGDLLPEPAEKHDLERQLALTGLLALGPKMLAEQDKEKLVADVVDEQIDVVSKTFLGSTVSCARCHDHKFDPFTQSDYTALAGVFQSTSVLANKDFVSRWREVDLATQAEKSARGEAVAAVGAVERSIEDAKRRGDAVSADVWRADFAAYLLAGEEAGRGTILVEAEEHSRGNWIADRETWGTKDVVIARTGDAAARQFAEFDITLPRAGAWQLEARYASAEERPLTFSIDGTLRVERALASTTGDFHPDGQRWERVGTFDLRAGRNVLRFERDGSIPHVDAFLLVQAPSADALVEWPAAPAWKPDLERDVVRAFALFLERRDRASDSVFRIWSEHARLDPDTFEVQAALLSKRLRDERAASKIVLSPLLARTLDGLPPTSLRELAGRHQVAFALVDEAWKSARAAAIADKAPTKLADADQEALREVLYGQASPFALTRAQRERSYPPQVRSELDTRMRELDAAKTRVPAAFASTPGANDGEPSDQRVSVRGNHLVKIGDAIPRGVPAVLARDCALEAIGARESGRLQLGRWLVDPRHPLTARVMANRIWQSHFGAGIVRTPSNFGLRGEAPTHPELLDWLAAEFVRGGWSTKALHRLIVTSRAYRLSARANERMQALDPENRWLARFPRQRLDAESIRDGLLAVAGTLDRTLGGSLFATKNGDYVTNDQSADAVLYDSRRRTLYLPVIRNALYDLLGTFDYGDPSLPNEARSSTTDANQSLWLLNSPLALDASLAFAKSLLALSSVDDRARVERAWLQAYARAPDAREIERALEFVASARSNGGDEGAWQALCQALFASNEFLYVD